MIIARKLVLFLVLICIGLTGCTKLKQENTSNTNVKIAIIDTDPIDTKHPALKNKIIGNYDFRAKVACETDDHATAVAGIIAAKGQVTGIAPDASILAYRAADYYTDDGRADGKSIVKAIRHAVSSGARVINISQDSQDPAVPKAIDEAVKSKVVVVVSAGNSGRGRNKMGIIAKTSSAITVGNCTQSRPTPMINIKGTSHRIELEDVGKSIDFPLRGTYETVHIESNINELKESVKGKIVLFKKRNEDLETISRKLKTLGATAVIVYNTKEDDQFHPISYEGCEVDKTKYIPIALIANSYAQILKGQISGDKEMIITSMKTQRMERSSSAGEITSKKPDLVAPGEGIMTTYPGNKYGKFGGTSAAAPIVTGTIATILQKYPSLTPQQVKDILIRSAVRLQDTENNYYPKYIQGAGKVDLTRAMQIAGDH